LKQQTPKAAPEPYHLLPMVNKDVSIETGSLKTTFFLEKVHTTNHCVKNKLKKVNDSFLDLDICHKI